MAQAQEEMAQDIRDDICITLAAGTRAAIADARTLAAALAPRSTHHEYAPRRVAPQTELREGQALASGAHNVALRRLQLRKRLKPATLRAAVVRSPRWDLLQVVARAAIAHQQHRPTSTP